MRPQNPLHGLIAAVLCCAALSAVPCHAVEDFAKEAATLKTRYVSDLGQLADWCRQKNLTTEAKTTDVLLAPPDPNKIVLPVLPPEISSTAEKGTSPIFAQHPPGLSGKLEMSPFPPGGDQAQWQRRLWKLRQDHAAALFALAQHAAAGHQASLAYRLALDAIRTNPDHEAARRVFGFQKCQNQWRTPFEVRMLRGGMVWHEKFGWIEKAHLPRYRSGERLMGATWIDAASDAALHADITHGWDVETEHYRIRTNQSIEAGVALGIKLEDLNRVWRQIFIGYYASAAEVAALFSDRPLKPEAQARKAGPYVADEPTTRQNSFLASPSGFNGSRMEVVYFRDKEQYHRALKPIMPEVGISLGLYVAENRTAYFYAGNEDSERTTYHEATHQLFQQSRRVGTDIGRKANCWLIEGIALYMETLRREGDSFVLGGLNDVRMTAARYHVEKKDFYVPFDKLVHMGVEDVQTHPQIAKLYSQIAGMTNFLIHYDGGRYRDSLVACLAAIYDGSQDPDLLAQRTGVNYAELDKQYQAYMRESPR